MPEETPPPATGVTPPPEPPAKSDPPATPPVVRIEVTQETFKRFQDNEARLAEIDAANRKAMEEKEAARLKALAEKGEVERALNELREKKDAELKAERDRADSLQSAILAEKKAGTLGTLLIGPEYVSTVAADQVRQLWEPRLESVRDPSTGAVTVREKGTGRPAEEVVKAWLGSPDAAHFLKGSTAGGAGAAGTHQSGEAPIVPGQSEGEQAWAHWRDRTEELTKQGYAPLGLRIGSGLIPRGGNAQRP